MTSFPTALDVNDHDGYAPIFDGKHSMAGTKVLARRGRGTFLHIVNGQLMAVMIDDDPASPNNRSGQFGIEIEATTKVSVRNLWVKRLK